jgi:3-oxoacyl-[acyl-carrier protein] reductase
MRPKLATSSSKNFEYGLNNMIDPGLKNKVALVTGGNNPSGIGAAVARALAGHGAKVFIHYFRQPVEPRPEDRNNMAPRRPGLAFFFEQQRKSADEVLASIRDAGGNAEAWEGDFGDAGNVHRLFEQAEKAFGHIDILVNNAAECMAVTECDSACRKMAEILRYPRLQPVQETLRLPANIIV